MRCESRCSPVGSSPALRSRGGPSCSGLTPISKPCVLSALHPVRSLEDIEKLPLTGNGKIVRRSLAEMFKEDKGRGPVHAS